MKYPSLSIIIPVYKEEERIGKNLENIFQYVRKHKIDYEIILSNDGTPDKSIEVAMEVVKKYDPAKVQVVGNWKKINWGKGHAVRIAMKKATKDIWMFTDADGSTAITELDKFWEPLQTNDIVIGSRRLAGAHIKKHQPGLKETLGRVGNWVIQLLTVRGIEDTQAGFKAFGPEAHKLFQHQTINRWSFDVELLVMAQMAGLKVAQVPIDWVNDERSTVLPFDYVKALVEILRIRFNVLRGLYKGVKKKK